MTYATKVADGWREGTAFGFAVEAALGYVVHPDSRGRGVATEALRMVVEWAFRLVADGGPGKRRLRLTTAASNTASRYAAERAGFVHIATEPEAFTTGEEGFDDTVVYHQLNPRVDAITRLRARCWPSTMVR